ncbi:SLAIN motif-containing protein 2-like [Cebus imitator]|uniref:SLAIN motif-containing protein 2-like n=1 Tax=Cebus imitator TaxID=2715852 RepID=UPI00189A1CA6|nr:SLAIN motif-containing protein 2-like [Cebus imitator]
MEDANSQVNAAPEVRKLQEPLKKPGKQHEQLRSCSGCAGPRLPPPRSTVRRRLPSLLRCGVPSRLPLGLQRQLERPLGMDPRRTSSAELRGQLAGRAGAPATLGGAGRAQESAGLGGDGPGAEGVPEGPSGPAPGFVRPVPLSGGDSWCS